MENRNSINNLKSVYYGTRNISLNKCFSLNPNFNAKNIFEFGNGAYFSFDEKIANEYIIKNSLNEYARSIGTPEESKYTEKNGNTHEYKLNLSKLKEYGVFNVDETNIEDVLTTTITKYRDNGLEKGYKPNREATIGILIGKKWDDFWDGFFNSYKDSNVELKLMQLTKKRIKNMVKDFIEDLPDSQQICIHQGVLNNSLVEGDAMRYFNNTYLSYSKKVPITYMAKEEKGE